MTNPIETLRKCVSCKESDKGYLCPCLVFVRKYIGNPAKKMLLKPVYCKKLKYVYCVSLLYTML